jgi:hypothetical protein
MQKTGFKSLVVRLGLPISILLIAGACEAPGPDTAAGDVGATAVELSATQFSFAGRTWDIRNDACSPDAMPAAPGPNYWCAEQGSGKDVWVDPDGKLHLKVRYHSELNAYSSVEVQTMVSGCGSYEFVVDGTSGMPDSLNENVILGMFTYASSTSQEHYEVDVEISDWGVPPPAPPTTRPAKNTRYTSYIADVEQHVASDDYYVYFNSATPPRPAPARAEHSFVWQNVMGDTTVAYQSVMKYSDSTPDWTFGSVTHPSSIVPACPTSPIPARINLWLFRGIQPGSTTLPAQEVVISDFSFVKLAQDTNLKATAGDRTVTLSWTDGSWGEDEHIVERSTDNATWTIAGTVDGTPDAGPMSFTDTNRDPSITYYYRIRPSQGSTIVPYATVSIATTSPILYQFGGTSGFVSGQLSVPSPQTYHVRTWVWSVDGYYPQGLVLQPASNGAYNASRLFLNPGGTDDGSRRIFVTLHPSNNDQYGVTVPTAGIPNADWPSALNSNVIVLGPYATGAMNYAQKVVLRSAAGGTYLRSSPLDVMATSAATATKWWLVPVTSPSPAGPVKVGDTIRLKTTDTPPQFLWVRGATNPSMSTTSSIDMVVEGYNCDCPAGISPVYGGSMVVRLAWTLNQKRLKYQDGGADVQFLSGGGGNANWYIEPAP